MLKKKKTNFLSILLIMSLVIGAIGIANVDTSFAATKKVHVKKKAISVYVGNTYQQKLIDKKGKTIKATKVKWKSKKTSVAKINKKGKITAVKAGTAKMTAKYKGKTYKFTVKVKKRAAPSSVIYNYVRNNGYSVNSDYVILGNRCIESDVIYGSNYSDIYIISIDTSNTSKIYFGLFRTKAAPGRYKDTTESTVLEYDINSNVGHVSFFQQYYTSSSYSSRSSYICQGTITYKNYRAKAYYEETGITDITTGFNHNPVDVGSYESKALVNGVNDMTRGVDNLLNSTLKIRLRQLGFSNL